MKQEISAGGIVYRYTKIQKREWLVIQHSSRKNHWGFPKGLVGDINSSESKQEAALREVNEEGGVTAEIITLITPPSQYIYSWAGTKIQKQVWYFLMKYISGNTNNHDYEVACAKFVKEKKVLSILTYENDKKQFNLALKLLQNTHKENL